MIINYVDWTIIIVFLLLLTAIGLISSKGGADDSTSYFLSKRNMPWWLLGISMVATTFSLGTPNLVTDMVRAGGVAQNWQWWCFLLSGMLTVFVYSKLWNRSKIMTDLEFYEVRYSGKEAAFLRGFRSIYLGFFFNIFILASAALALLKFAAMLLGINPVLALVIISAIILAYSTIGGLKSILWTDFFLFIVAMGGAFVPPFYIINSPQIGGLGNFLTNDIIVSNLGFFPDFTNAQTVLTIFLIPITIQWWASWYPGSEPGGGGYITQRILSAKSEKDAVKGTLLFNVMHYAVRPWPWIVVGLASLIIFPNLDSMVQVFNDVDPKYIQNDIAYSAMLRRFLPHGILGVVLASLIAAYMSTVSTQINWGASYLVNDFYSRFINPNASEKKKVLVGRIWTISLIVLSIVLALYLESALQVFQYMLLIGAGTGLIYLLRWFWWRINAWSEISAMIGAMVFSLIVIVIEKISLVQLDDQTVIFHGLEMQKGFWDTMKFVFVVVFNSLLWITVTFCTRSTEEKILVNFYRNIRPGGPGWKKITKKHGELERNRMTKDWNVPAGLWCMSISCIGILSMLFSMGYLIYGNITGFVILLVVTVISAIVLFKSWGKIFN